MSVTLVTYLEFIAILLCRYDGRGHCTHSERVERDTDTHPDGRDYQFKEVTASEVTIAYGSDRLERPV